MYSINYSVQTQLKSAEETIKNLEKKLKEDLVEKETLLENAKKEKNELQKLLSIETQKSIQLKKFAEEEQKKHIKYKNKLAKYKKSKTEEKKIEKEKPENKNPDFDFFIYSNSPLFDENKNIAKLKEDIFKLKQLLDEEKNKNEVLRLLSENQKEKHDMVKNKYNKTKKLNLTLMNKIREKEFSLNKEIKMENEALKKQLIETENKKSEKRLANYIGLLVSSIVAKYIIKFSTNDLVNISNRIKVETDIEEIGKVFGYNTDISNDDVQPVIEV